MHSLFRTFLVAAILIGPAFGQPRQRSAAAQSQGARLSLKPKASGFLRSLTAVKAQDMRKVAGMVRDSFLTNMPGGFVSAGWPDAPEDNAGQQALDRLSDQLHSLRIERVEILCVPRYILSDQRMTPELLRNDYSYKLTIPRFNTNHGFRGLIAALKRTTAVNTSTTGDVRWGLHITLEDGSVHRLYMDGYGKFGQIDDVQVAWSGTLYHWFRSFSNVMK